MNGYLKSRRSKNWKCSADVCWQLNFHAYFQSTYIENYNFTSSFHYVFCVNTLQFEEDTQRKDCEMMRLKCYEEKQI